MKITSKQPQPRIKAITVVDHYVRNQLKLNADQYVLMDILYQNPKIQLEDICINLGYDINYFKLVYESLVSKQLIDLNNSVTDKWKKYFTVSKEEFEEFWKVFHVGSKAEAKEIYLKARKIVDGDTLLDAAKKYVKFKEFNGQYLEHTRTWLNPKYQKWNDDYSIPVEQNSTIQPMIIQSTKIHP
jgi:DNA-binding MarR family transcriptional regulator